VDAALTRSASLKTERVCRNFSVMDISDDILDIFNPITTVLLNSAVTKDPHKLQLTMGSHSIIIPAPGTKATFVEVSTLLNSTIQEALQRILEESSEHDGVKRKCKRALANHYETQCNGSSRSFVPMLAPHRDDVGAADISLVLGITPAAEFRGAMLYVSSERNGNIWYNKPGQPSRRSVIGVDVSRGKCIILRNAAMHYVSLIQRGARQSLVFHMKREEQ